MGASFGVTCVFQLPEGPSAESRPATAATSLLGSIDKEKDLYLKYKKLQRQLEFLQVQEDYIKDEQKNLKREYLRSLIDSWRG